MLTDLSKYPSLVKAFQDLTKAQNREDFLTTTSQSLFTLTNGSYAVGTKTLSVYIEGVLQPSDTYTETSGTTFTLNDPVPAGTLVSASWLEGKVPVVFGHKSTHEKGGQDEIDITKLKGYDEQVSEKISQVFSKVYGFVNIHEFEDSIPNKELIPDPLNWDWTQAFIDAIASISKGAIELGNTTYKLNGEINTQGKPIRFVGKGSSNTIIKPQFSGTLFNWSGTKDAFISLSGLGLQGVTIEGGDYDVNAIKLVYTARGNFSDIVVNRVAGHGIYLRSMQDSTFENIYLRYCGLRAKNTYALYLDKRDSLNDTNTVNNVNDNKFLNVTFEHDNGRLLYSEGDSNNCNIWMGCKFEYNNTSNTTYDEPVYLDGVDRYQFIACRYTHYKKKMFKILSSQNIRIEGNAYNSTDPEGFADVSDSYNIDFNVTGRKVGKVLKSGNSYGIYESKIHDTERVYDSVYLMDDFNPLQAVNLRNVHYKLEGAVITDDVAAKDGYAIKGSSTDYQKVIRVGLTRSDLSSSDKTVSLLINSRSTTQRAYEVRVRSSSNVDTIVATITVGTSYSLNRISIPTSVLTKDCSLVINNMAGQSGSNLFVDYISYSLRDTEGEVWVTDYSHLIPNKALLSDSNSWDWTAAIAEAIRVAKTTNRKKVVLPSGIVKFSQINLTRVSGDTTRFQITIEGSLNTILVPDKTQTKVFNVGGYDDGSTAQFLKNVTLRNFQLLANGIDGNSYAGTGFEVSIIQNFNMENIVIDGFLNGGLILKEVWDSNFNNVRMLHCGKANSDADYAYALRITKYNNYDNSNAIRFNQLHIEQCPLMLLADSDARHIYFYGSKLEHGSEVINSSTQSPIAIGDALEIGFDTCQFVKNSNSDEPFITVSASQSTYQTTNKLEKTIKISESHFVAPGNVFVNWFNLNYTELNNVTFNSTNGSGLSYPFRLGKRNKINNATFIVVTDGTKTFEITGDNNIVDTFSVEYKTTVPTSGAFLKMSSGVKSNRLTNYEMLGSPASLYDIPFTYLDSNIVKRRNGYVQEGITNSLVHGADVLVFAHTSNSSISTINYLSNGQSLVVQAKTVTITLTYDPSKLVTKSGSDFSLTPGKILRLININGILYEN